MPRRATAASLLALACSSPLLLAGSALADGGTPVTADGSGWVSRPVNTQVLSGPLDPVNGLVSTSTIPAIPVSTSVVPTGDLAVAGGLALDGEPGSESYLSFDLSKLDPATTAVKSLVATLALDSAYAGSTSAAASAPPLEACLVTGHFFRVEDGDWATRPPEDCTKAVTGTFDSATSTYSFDLSSYAASWVGPDADNEGVSIRPPAGYGLSSAEAPFDLAFLGGTKLVGALTTTVTGAATTVTQPVTTAVTAIKGGLKPTTTSSAPVPAAAPVPTVVTPVNTPQDVTTTLPAATPLEAYADSQNPAPTVAGTAAAPASTQRIASAASVVPTISAQGAVPVFWLAVVGGAVVLFAASWVTGAAGPAVVRLPVRR